MSKIVNATVLSLMMVFLLTGCGGDDAATKAEEAVPAAEVEKAQTEHPAAEHPAKEHPSNEHPSKDDDAADDADKKTEHPKKTDHPN